MLGVDGWQGSWVAAHLRGTAVSAELLGWHTGRFADLLRMPVAAVAVDIPVGLPDHGRRTCDLAARAALPGAASRVFLTGPRPAYRAPDLAAANRWLRARGEPALSAQAFALRAAVLEVDACADDARIVEAHPEVSLARLAGRPLASKRTAQGVAQRVQALTGWVDVVAALAAAPRGVPADDALDALATGWTALRWATGEAEVLGGVPDGHGRPMRIVV